MLLYFLGLLAFGFTVSAFAVKSGRAILSFAAAGAWILMAVSSYILSTYPATGVYDINYGLFWLGCGMVFVCVLVPAVLREKKEEAGDDGIDEIDRPLHESFKKDEEDRAYLDKIMPRRARRERNPRKPSGSMFDKTGIIGRVKK